MHTRLDGFQEPEYLTDVDETRGPAFETIPPPRHQLDPRQEEEVFFQTKVAPSRTSRPKTPQGLQEPGSAARRGEARSSGRKSWKATLGEKLRSKSRGPRNEGKAQSSCEEAREIETFAVGDVVEYWSQKQNEWIEAKVLVVNPTGTYDLDCKPAAPPEKIRPLAVAAEAPGGRRGGRSSSRATAAERTSSAARALKSGVKYAVGEVVEYYSQNILSWVPATVIGKNANGTYKLDCKPYAAIEKIRRPEPAPAPSVASTTATTLGVAESKFIIGEIVEYESKTQGCMLTAKVLGINADGTYRLDVKPDAAPEKIRRPLPPAGFETFVPEQPPQEAFRTKMMETYTGSMDTAQLSNSSSQKKWFW